MRATWRAALLGLCAAGIIYSFCTVLDQSGTAGTAPWYGMWGAYLRPAPVAFHLVVSAIDPDGSADRAGLRDGDLIDMRALDLNGRLKVLGQPVTGQPITFAILRGTQHLELVFAARPFEIARFWNYFIGDFAALWMVLFAAIIAWKRPYVGGNLLLATSLALVGIGAQLWPVSFTTPWTWTTILTYVASCFAPLAIGAWATFASTYARPLGPARRVALAACWVLVAIDVLAGVGIPDITLGLLPIVGTVTMWFDPTRFFGMLWGLPNYGAFAAALACSALAVAASSGVERQRAWWSLAPLSLMFVVEQLDIYAFGSLSYSAALVIGFLGAFVLIVATLALTYAALNRRLIDIGFVLNRTVVFATISAIVVAAFVLVEWAASEWFAGTNPRASTAISMAVALILGVSLRYIHRFADRFVDNVFFRKRHDDEEALRRFAHEAAFVRDPAKLLERAAIVVRDHAGTDAASILVRSGAAFNLANGGDDANAIVDADDPAIVQLSTWKTPVDLHAIRYTKLSGELAFPMVVRGELVGVLLCGAKRTGEAYAPDETRALLEVAQGVGTALATGRTDEIATIVDTQMKIVQKLDVIAGKLS